MPPLLCSEQMDTVECAILSQRRVGRGWGPCFRSQPHEEPRLGAEPTYSLQVWPDCANQKFSHTPWDFIISSMTLPYMVAK